MSESRLFKILYHLLEKGKGTASELAEKFEVSVRTIYRDIDRLSQAGIPLYCSRGKGGGIFLLPNFVLDKSLLSDREKGELLTSIQGLGVLGASQEGELLSKLQALFQMKSERWLQVDLTGWSGRDGQGDFALIKQAILQKRVLDFSYLASQGRWTQRRAEPLRLIFKGDWYLAAFCQLKSDMRFFKLSRMKNCQLTDQIFSRENPPKDLEMVAPAEDLVKLRLKFDKKAAFRLLEEFPEEAVTEAADAFYVESFLPRHDRLYAYLLSFLDSVEVLEPADIRQDFQALLKKIFQKYKS